MHDTRLTTSLAIKVRKLGLEELQQLGGLVRYYYREAAGESRLRKLPDSTGERVHGTEDCSPCLWEIK
jgi:hypothetical protein